MLGGRTWTEWVGQYAESHQHPVNRFCHTVGIPLIAISLPLLLVTFFVPWFWKVSLALFVIGWIFQFIGHAFEGKPPEFFHDWRFLFVGLRCLPAAGRVSAPTGMANSAGQAGRGSRSGARPPSSSPD